VGVGAGVGVGVGVGAALGVGDAAGELPPLFFFAGRFTLTGDGNEPEGENDATCGAGGGVAGVTAEGAAAVLLLPPALPTPNAAPKATTAARIPMSATF
jgi:hypothetical protein